MDAEEAPQKETVAGAVEGTSTDPSSEGDQGIGARVTAVFTAAEKAGQHIVTLAREEANDILREARVEAEAYLKQQRLEADREVERILADARRRGEAIEDAARNGSRQVEDDARVRKERLREETRLIEERIGWAKEGLREVSDRIAEVFLEEQPAPPAAEEPQQD
jgi:cell division septum initiation protein DivIVA